MKGRLPRLALAAVLGGSALTAGEPPAGAAAKRTKVAPAKDKTKDKAHANGKAGDKTGGKAKAAAKANDPPDEPVPVPGSKLAVFPFTGDDGGAIQRQVLHVLRSKGMKPNTTLRPMFDTAEQYRETATTLGLVAYVDGEVAADGTEGSATVHLRSGATGLRLWSMTFAGDRRQLPNDIGKRLWDAWSPALGKACADAAKPRKPDREPMRINAGTPLADPPAGN
jgi:hypothetical protein